MPSKLADALARRLGPKSEGASRLAEVTTELEGEAAYKLTIAIERCPTDHLILVEQKDRAEVVVRPKALAEWRPIALPGVDVEKGTEGQE